VSIESIARDQTHQVPPFSTVVFHVSSVRPSPTVRTGAASTSELADAHRSASAVAAVVDGEKRIGGDEEAEEAREGCVEREEGGRGSERVTKCLASLAARV
jgi:hypothetical protein